MNLTEVEKESRRYERFLKFLSLEDSGCWVFKGHLNNRGYGQFGIGARKEGLILAHRYSYMVYKGEIPEGLVIDHKCRNPKCCNPDHLEPVSRKENVRRGVCGEAFPHQKKQFYLKRSNVISAKTTCKNGHELAPDNIYYTKTLGVNGKPWRKCKICVREQCRNSYLRRTKLNQSKKVEAYKV